MQMKEVLVAFHDYVNKKYNAEAGFITMNMPRLLDMLEEGGVKNPIICSSINKVGFRMSGGKELYENTLKTRQFRAIAMQVLAGGAVPAREAIEYVCSLPGVESILFGASSKVNIQETVSLIHQYDKKIFTS
jgi:aryl-alcohol dehydrogenase-like predicted oxidoreductase